MSGRRCKALRRAFRERYGRSVRKAEWRKVKSKLPGLFSWEVSLSEWRRLKKHGLPA